VERQGNGGSLCFRAWCENDALPFKRSSHLQVTFERPAFFSFYATQSPRTNAGELREIIPREPQGHPSRKQKPRIQLHTYRFGMEDRTIPADPTELRIWKSAVYFLTFHLPKFT